jgi:hypothetical protein
MSRSAPIDRSVFVSLSLLCVGSWWGCAKASGDPTTQASSTSSASSSAVSSGTGGGGGGGTGGAGIGGGDGGGGDAGACVSTSAPTQHIPLDIVFLIDQSTFMQGPSWATVTAALPAFFKDPASVGVGAGLVLFPYSAGDCDVDHYKTLTVPIGVLPANGAALTSAFPTAAVGVGRPMYPALQGALLQATAHQDANPTHKVIVVLATDGDPYDCDTKIDDVAALAASALAYNGVRTYVIGLPGASIADLSKIAAAGGTMTADNVSININQFATSVAEIRTVGLGCDYAIPPPPGSQQLDPTEVNFSYTPKGVGPPVILLRAQDLAGCNGQPGWYYDSDTAPTKIVLCPASCATVQADTSAAVDVLFGCKSLLN